MSDVDHYDEQSGKEVFQDEELDLGPGIIPVRIEGTVRTDQMPTRSYYMNRVLKTGQDAEKILGADPRRKRIIIWGIQLGTGVESVCIAESQSSAQAFMGAHLTLVTVSVRYEITDRGEIWARPCDFSSTAGTWTGFAVSADDVILNMVIEQWTN